MATLKITDLPDISSAATLQDVLAVVDVSDTSEADTGTTKRVEIQQLFENTPIHAPSIQFGGTVLGHYEEGAWTPVLTGFAGSPTVTGSYTRIGNVMFCRTRLLGMTTCTAGTSQISGLPVTQAAVFDTCVAADNTAGIGLGTGSVAGSIVYPPSWSATNVAVCFTYIAA